MSPSGDVVVLGSKVVVDRRVEISASVVDNCERMLWSVVKRSATVELSVVTSGRSDVVGTLIVVETKLSVVVSVVGVEVRS